MPPYPMPDIRNFTRPSGFALFIDAGQGYKHLGNIDLSKCSTENKITEIEVETQLTGDPLLADVITARRDQTFKLGLQEVTPETLQIFDLGGPVTLENPGTAPMVDQVLALPGEVPASVGQCGISAVTLRQFLDFCFQYTGGAFVDHSAAADQAAGSAFDILGDPTDVLYLGKTTPFKELYFNLAVPGSYTGLAFKYWNGAIWTALIGLVGAGDALAASGAVTFTLPADWQQNLVNGILGYFIQVSASGVTTQATVTNIRHNLTRNVDYILDSGTVSPTLASGRLGRLASGLLADGETVKASYSYTTWEALTYTVLTEDYQHVAARIDHLTNKGTRFRRYIPKCLVKPDGAMSFDSKKELQIPIILQTLADYVNNPDKPYGWREILY